METIKNIEELENFDGYDGYKLTTNIQEILILIDNNQSCCENWGYFVSEENISNFIGSEIIEVYLTDKALNTKLLNEKLEYGVDNGEVVFVNINTTKGLLQFAVYNSHNGYYGHEIIIKSNQLNAEKWI